MIQSSFLFANITNKIGKLTSSIGIILLALQKDVRTYAGNLIYGVRLQVNVGDRLAKKEFGTLLYCSEKNLRK